MSAATRLPVSATGGISALVVSRVVALVGRCTVSDIVVKCLKNLCWDARKIRRNNSCGSVKGETDGGVVRIVIGGEYESSAARQTNLGSTSPKTVSSNNKRSNGFRIPEDNGTKIFCVGTVSELCFCFLGAYGSRHWNDTLKSGRFVEAVLLHLCTFKPPIYISQSSSAGLLNITKAGLSVAK